MKFKHQLMLSNVISFSQRIPFDLRNQNNDIFKYRVVGMSGIMKLPKIYFPVMKKIEKTKLAAIEPNFGEQKCEIKESYVPPVKVRKEDKVLLMKRRSKIKISSE